MKHDSTRFSDNLATLSEKTHANSHELSWIPTVTMDSVILSIKVCRARCNLLQIKSSYLDLYRVMKVNLKGT